MRKLTDIFAEKDRTFSFEIFPPKTDKGMASLKETLAAFESLPFDYASVTYGAGGSSREKTSAIVRELQEVHGIPALHHFTCVAHTRSEIGDILDRLEKSGVLNLLALRGDPPKDQPDWRPGPDNFRHSSELVAYIKERYGERFAVGVAGFPEGHPMAPDLETDADVMKRKIDAGGDFIVTQLFFDNRDYFAYVKRLRDRGVRCRVIPGVLPITNYRNAVNFAEGCKATVSPEVHEIFGPIAEDEGKTREAGIAFAIRQCRALLAGGAPGIHFYALNKIEPVSSIIKGLGI